MSLMEKFLTRYQFSERHQTVVRCRPAELLDIIQNFKPPPDRFAEFAMSARHLPARLLHAASRSQAPAPEPFTAERFVPLERDGNREIVGGLVGKFWRPDLGLQAIDGPSEFLDCNPPRTAKLVLGFVAERSGDNTLLTTETRVYCPDRYSLIMFTPYWWGIRAVSGLLRRRMLRDIRQIAEQTERAAPA